MSTGWRAYIAFRRRAGERNLEHFEDPLTVLIYLSYLSVTTEPRSHSTKRSRGGGVSE
jgi:hypothetical protein